MNKAANSYWIDSRLAAQRPAARALTLVSAAPELSPMTAPSASTATRTQVRRRSFSIPSWVVFATIILATFALCVTVTMRTHAEKRSAAQKFDQMSTEVEQLRHRNAAIKREVERLRSDPRAIEAAARSMNMVRSNEVVLPIE